MQTVILAGSPPGWHARDLARAARERGVAPVFAHWPTLAGRVGGGPAVFAPESECAGLMEADLILPRTVPRAGLESIILRMDLLRRLETAGARVLNGAYALETAVDKYLALTRLEAAGLRVPETVVCQDARTARQAFDALGCDVVVKPLFGSEGFGLMRVTEQALAQRVFAALEQTGAVMYVQRFVQRVCADLRLFVLGGVCEAALQRAGTRFPANIGRGGEAHAYEPGAALTELAVTAAETCGAEAAGVDVLLDERQRPWVLEVNAVPGWRALQRVARIDVADRIVAHGLDEGRARR